MQQPAPYPYRTTREDVRIAMPDGTRLAARLWLPVTDHPVPALLEHQPGGLGDTTAVRDAQRHPWYAGHGYASLRVDARGHGSSEGAPADPASPAGTADGLALLDWLTARPWSSGRAGAFGIGRGGTAALALAAHAPETLAAVVAVCADDRTAPLRDLAGAPLAAAVHGESAARLAAACRPPDPRYTGDGWRRLWLERLAALDPGAGDEGERIGLRAVRAAVLAFGGWADPQAGTVLRLVEELGGNARGILGPWPHEYPDEGLPPGPAIGFLQETLRWWDHWLRGADTGVLKEPALRSWMNESVPPATSYANRPGRWIGDESWPSPDVREVHYGLDDALRTAGTPSGERFVPVRSPQHTGIDAGAVRPLGGPADLPPDQREEDGRSVCFDSVPLPEPAEVLGTPSVRLRVRMDARHGQVAARLCDVAPDGSATLVSRGAAALAGGIGPVEVEIGLAAVAHAFPAGHRIRLALSSAYWPWLWPVVETGGFEVDPGGSALTLPVRHLAADAGSGPVSFDPPEQAAAPAELHTEPLTAHPERQAVHDVAAGEWRLQLARPEGAVVHPDGLAEEEHVLEAYRIRSDDPLSARARTDRTLRLERTDIGWDVTLQIRSEASCDAGHVTVRDHVRAFEGGDVVFERIWRRRLARGDR
ncbi:CocE/NonD family hydrolase [Streptomyces sp. NRRL B-24484]|uniref:CocE/NonD family hydrolase n=1 Tax=Streptomyces sp. NRRL B-24484 TaxID=1463833 RepID=UPI0004C29A50|nr:CocE/NonD family hydrolase [Streptomyces sp. NRRL B-24484]